MIEAVLIGLGAWRLANLLVNENGPWDIFEILRLKVGIKPGPIEGFWPNLFSCIFCMSIWTAGLMYFLYQIEPVIVILAAAAAIAVIADRFVNGQM